MSWVESTKYSRYADNMHHQAVGFVMRLAGDWMTGADDRILEFLEEEGPSTPKKMHDDGRVRFSRTYINTRCKELSDYKLIRNLGNGVYQITDLGRRYLTGELDTADLGDDESEPPQASA